MRTLNDYFIYGNITLGTAGQVTVPVPDGGKVIKVFSTISAALTIGNETLTVKDAAGSSMGTLTLTQSGSAVGDVDTLEPTSNNAVDEGDFIEIETDGSNGTAAIAHICVVVRR